ncbi:hypothetical protein T4E_5783 [Trichinella pseudospiralis]|uniref:Uncharacterized protein n=1 Tax=Trichinella pseudospiralis TaxID=6337 RepID=A0A0V0XY53_TRIPS|nr:hypothetical protein T4E_5783 [Trichinella pseudospiralis]
MDLMKNGIRMEVWCLGCSERKNWLTMKEEHSMNGRRSPKVEPSQVGTSPISALHKQQNNNTTKQHLQLAEALSLNFNYNCKRNEPGNQDGYARAKKN